MYLNLVLLRIWVSDTLFPVDISPSMVCIVDNCPATYNAQPSHSIWSPWIQQCKDTHKAVTCNRNTVYSHTPTAKISLTIYFYARSWPALPTRTQPRSALFADGSYTRSANFSFPVAFSANFVDPNTSTRHLISPPGRSHCWWSGTKPKLSRPSVRPYLTQHRRSRTCYECLVPPWCPYFGLFPLQRCLFSETKLHNAPGPSILYYKPRRQAAKATSLGVWIFCPDKGSSFRIPLLELLQVLESCWRLWVSR